MSQYYPTACAASDPILGRTITQEEYREVTEALERLGFHKGWVQDYESNSHYRPDFIKDRPFE
jgi:putative pyruvate formate lyase activating enzyme